jgi:hypothetical protein
MTLGDFSGRDLLFARPEERLSLVSLGSRSGCSEPPLSLSSEWAPLPQAPPWTAPRQGSGPGWPPFDVRRWWAERGGGEPLTCGAEPSGVLRLLASSGIWAGTSHVRQARVCAFLQSLSKKPPPLAGEKQHCVLNQFIVTSAEWKASSLCVGRI